MTADIINLADLRPADPNIRNPLAAADHGRWRQDRTVLPQRRQRLTHRWPCPP